MTDKKIIMDASKCKHYWNGNCSDWDNTLIGACDDFEDCYCKMYIRKEQECEEWKKDYATAKGMYDLCQSDFMELAKIKDKYKQALQDIKSLCLEQNLKADFFACEILQKCEVLND